MSEAPLPPLEEIPEAERAYRLAFSLQATPYGTDRAAIVNALLEEGFSGAAVGEAIDRLDRENAAYPAVVEDAIARCRNLRAQVLQHMAETWPPEIVAKAWATVGREEIPASDWNR